MGVKIKGKFYCYECRKLVEEVNRIEDEYGRGFDECCLCGYPV